MARRIFGVCLVCIVLLYTLAGCAAVPDTLWLGAGEAEITLAEDETHYVAGYQGGLAADGVLDVPMVKAAFLRYGRRSYLLLSVDCVGLAAGTVERIRERVREFCPDTQIHVVSTHDHAGADTLGLWGKAGIDGKNPRDMESLLSAAFVAAVLAYYDMRPGQFYFSATDCADLIEDTRAPVVYDGNAYVFRFVPEDGGADTRLLLFPSHAEALGGGNTKLSADFPAYIARTIAAETGGRTLYFPGAIGGLLRTVTLSDDPIENCRLTGETIARRILACETELPLNRTVSIVTERVKIPCDNVLFRGMKFLGVLENDVTAARGRVTICTTVSLMQIGDKRVLLLPGEIFPELVYGTDPAFTPVNPDRADPTPLADILGSDILVIGLCDDEIGYIVPPSDYLLDETAPYLVTPPCDHNGENHYEETHSAGVEAAWAIERAVRRLARRIQ